LSLTKKIPAQTTGIFFVNDNHFFARRYPGKKRKLGSAYVTGLGLQ